MCPLLLIGLDWIGEKEREREMARPRRSKWYGQLYDLRALLEKMLNL